MSLGPTSRCFFCGAVYYTEKLAPHEFVCSMRPRKLTVQKAIQIAIVYKPESAKDIALLVRLVWQLRDAYRTQQPFARLTDPRLIIRTSLQGRKKQT